MEKKDLAGRSNIACMIIGMRQAASMALDLENDAIVLDLRFRPLRS